MLVAIEQILNPPAGALALRRLAVHIEQGRRDYITGGDQVTTPFIDRRVSGSLSLGLVIARIIASSLRLEGSDELEAPVLLLRGRMEPEFSVEVVPYEDWGTLETVELFADGAPMLVGTNSAVRRHTVVGPAGQSVADLSIRFGRVENDGVLAHYAQSAGVSVADCPDAVVIFLGERTIEPIAQVQEGGAANAWRMARSAAQHLSDTHVTQYVDRIFAQAPDVDLWRDDAFRAEIYKELVLEKGAEPSTHEFLDALALSSPLRKVFPQHLTRFFPEVEAIFLSNGEPLWDLSSPAERMVILRAAFAETAQRAS